MLSECLANNLIPIAKSFYSLYLEKIENKDSDNIDEKWNNLEEADRDTNFRIVLRLDEKLAKIGCYIDGAKDVRDADEKHEFRITKSADFTEQEREILSMIEHEMWFEEREESGWVYHPVTQRDNKRHSHMIPWSSMDKEARMYDYALTDNLIELLEKHNIYVYRGVKSTPDCIKHDKYYEKSKAPIILSVTGHTDVMEGCEEHIKKSLDNLYETLRARYPNTDLLLLSAMAEGADRIVVRWAFGKGIPVGPVIPISMEEYENTFSGTGYGGKDHIIDSQKDFKRLLEGRLEENDEKGKYTVYDPIFTTKGKQNRIKCFYELSAYLVSNSHILISIWDGRKCGLRGGTYDTTRMAYEGVDHDLVNCMPATSAIFGKERTGRAPLLNSGEDTLVYWIEAKRDSIDGKSDKEEREAPYKSKFINDEISKKRTPQTTCGFFFNRTLDDSKKPPWMERQKSYAISRVFKKSPPPIKNNKITIGSGPLFDDLIQVYDSIPQTFDDAFIRMDRLNRDLDDLSKKSNYTIDNEDNLFGKGKTNDAKETEIVKNECMNDMKNRFLNVFRLSEILKNRTKRSSRCISVLQILSTALFSFMILFSGSIILSVLYAIAYIWFIVWMELHKNFKTHIRYVEYRALAESLRVQYYWGILGINDTVNTNSYGYLKNGMMWSRSVLKGVCSAFANDYSKILPIPHKERVEFIKKYWIGEKIDYLARDGDKNVKAAGYYAKTISGLGILSILLALALSVFSLAYLNINDSLLFDVDGFFDGKGRVLFPDADFTWTTIIKVVIIIVTFILQLFSSFKSQTFTDTPQQLDAKILLYKLTKNKLHMVDNSVGTSETQNEQGRLDILHEMGMLEIDQNNDWVFEFIGKDVTNMKAGYSVKGGNDSGDDATSSQ